MVGVALSQFRPTAQESMRSYDIGFRLKLLDRRLKLNLAVFNYNDISKQVFVNKFKHPWGTLEQLVSLLGLLHNSTRLAMLKLLLAGSSLSQDVSQRLPHQTHADAMMFYVDERYPPVLIEDDGDLA